MVTAAATATEKPAFIFAPSQKAAIAVAATFKETNQNI